MSTFKTESITPFMPQGSEFVSKLIVTLPPNTTIDDVLPYLGKKANVGLTTEFNRPESSPLNDPDLNGQAEGFREIKAIVERICAKECERAVPERDLLHTDIGDNEYGEDK